MTTTKQISRLRVQEGFTADDVQQSLESVWRHVKPPDAFDGFDVAQQDQMVKSLQYAPAFVVYGMDQKGVPRELVSEQKENTVTFAPGVGVEPILLTPPIGERWLVTDFQADLVTGVGGAARRPALFVLIGTVGALLGQENRAEGIQFSGSAARYPLARGIQFIAAPGPQAPTIRIGAPTDGIEIIGPNRLALLTVNFAIVDEWSGSITYRIFQTPRSA